MTSKDASRVVAVVTPWYPTDENPVSGMFVLREVKALLNSGLDVRVVHLDRSLPAGQMVPDKVEGHRILRIGYNPANPVQLLPASQSLRSALVGADVVNSHAISVLPLMVLSKGDKPWVHTEHWSALSNPASASALLRLVRPIFASLLRLPDAVVAESEMLAEPIRVFRGRHVDLVPCIVPVPSRLAERDPNPTVVRLSSTGGVIDRKDPLLAVRTLAALRDLGVEASLRWTGEGDLKEQAQELAKELGVDAKFLGSGSPQDVENEIAHSDVFFAPTKGENFFVAAAEALVNGRPLVASEKGGHTEYADPRFTEIVTERTPKAYANAVLRVLEKSRGISAEEISKTVGARFSPAGVARSYKDIYQRVAAAREPAT